MLTYLFIGLLCVIASFSLIFGVVNAVSKRNKILALIIGLIALIGLIFYIIYLFNNPIAKF